MFLRVAILYLSAWGLKLQGPLDIPMYAYSSASGWFILCAFPCLLVSTSVRVCDSMCIFMFLHVSGSPRVGDSVCICVFCCRSIWSAHATWQVQTLQVWKKHYNRKCSGFQLPDGISLRKIPLPGPLNKCSILCLSWRGWVEGVYVNLDPRGHVFQEFLAEPWNSTPCHSPLARPTSSSWTLL